MKTLFYKSILLLSLLKLHSQESKIIDSLKIQIQNNKAEFTTYNLLAWEYIQIEQEQTLKYNQLSEKLIKNNKDKGKYLILNAAIKSIKADLIGCEKDANEGIKLSILENDYETISSGYNILARIYLMQGIFNKTEFYSNKAYNFSLKTKDKKKILKSIINYGSALSQNGKIEKGIEIYKSAEKYFYKNCEFEKGYLYFNLARLFFNKDDIKNALINLKKSEEQFQLIDNNVGDIYQVYSTYGEIYTQLKDKKNALFYLEKAKKHSRNEIDESDILFIKAQLFFNLNKFDLANSNINEAIKLNEKNQDFSRLGEDYLLYSDILNQQKQYNLSEDYLKKAIKLFKKKRRMKI